ncbi:hypothetical protein OIU77_010262 [Salix suchowensis]|uniref:Uncharacterized protein n=1 Tax=Salix suchowensis TaxID=1278906 RepID=A0ABQ9A7Q0_9ROSI|nr:hypothetical protein OIU77_010262 [Salix suchowensis]
MKNEEQARSLFGICLTDRPRWKQFLICSSGFFFGYIVNGICEEYVYNRLQFSYGWYFTFVQSFVYVLLIYLQGFTPKEMVNPWKTYVKLSAVLMGSHGLTKGSLAFLNYPAQIMFKSTKVLPVMVMGAFIPGLRRKYPAHEYASALLLVVGLILFTLADAQTSPNFSMVGVVMISGALIMDAFLGNFQEAIFTLNPETTQVMSARISHLCFSVKKRARNSRCWFFFLCTDGDAVLLKCGRLAFLDPSHGFDRRTIQSMEFMLAASIRVPRASF